jgi:uncharacterized pyridoxamine 5'-phosphate oxidase family protein
MGETRTRIEKEVHEHLKGTPTGYLATLEDGQPRVRPVALVVWDERLWITSGTRNGKTRQMRRNPDIELCVPISEGGHQGYVRLAGEARFVGDAKTREALAKAVVFFKDYWEGADDARFTLVELVPTEIEYLRPNEMEPHTVYL